MYMFNGYTARRPVYQVFWGILFLLTAPVCVAGGWTRGLMCPSPHRDEFEIPNLEDLRLEIPGDEPNTLYISAIGTFSLKQTK